MNCLHLAGWSGQHAIVQFLLDKVSPSKVNSPSEPSGNTALHYSSWKNQLDCCKVLLQRGANKEIKNAVRFSCAHME